MLYLSKQFKDIEARDLVSIYPLSTAVSATQ